MMLTTKVLKPRVFRIALLVFIDWSSDLIFENRQYASIISVQVAIKGIKNISERYKAGIESGNKIGIGKIIPANTFMKIPTM